MQGTSLKNLISRIPDPDDFVLNKIKNMPENLKVAFFSSVVFFVLVHSAVFLNKFVNEDDIFGLRADNRWLLILGRWFAGYVTALRGPYSIPWVIGVFAMAYFVIAVMITVSTLGIKSKIFVVLTSFAMASFPTLAYWFGYAMAPDTVTAAILLSAIAVYLTKEYKYGYLLGAFVLMLSLAIYQAFLGFAIGLCIILIIKQLFDESNDIKDIMRQLLKYLLLGVLGLIAYMISVRISLILSGNHLASYAGIDTMGQIPLSRLPFLIIQSYYDFLLFFGQTNRFFFVSDVLYFLYIAIILLGFYFLIFIIISKKIYKCYVKFLLLIFMLLAMPIGLNIIGVLAPERSVGTLNIYQFVLAGIFVFVLFEIYNQLKNQSKKSALLKWIVVAIAFSISCNYLQTSGLYYFRLHIFYERTYALYNRMLTRVEDSEGFKEGIPLAIIGSYPPHLSVNPSSQQFPEIINTQGSGAQFIGVNTNQPLKPRAFIDHYLGVNFALANNEQIDMLMQNDEFWYMPTWPKQGSVQVIDDIIVVKLSRPNPVIRIEQVEGVTHLIQSTPFPNNENYLFAWYVYRNGERIYETEYIRGFSYFEYDFTEYGRYSLIMFIRTPNNEFFMPAIFSGLITFD